jgi:inhibitor of KinA
MPYKLRYSRFSAYSILIEWPAIIDELILKDILIYKNSIEEKLTKQNIEVISTYSSILIIYQFTIDSVNDEISTLKTLYAAQKKSIKIKSRLWEIPVCYDDEFGVDLEAFSMSKGISNAEIIRGHSEAIYTVFFIGFLPGFLYLGGLDSSLFLDRKTTPNLNVKKGSVAIGGQQTGIYPQDSPGGWHCIGNSPVELFNANENPPCKIKAGDKVKFVPIEKSEYYNIFNAISTSQYQLKSIHTNA